MTNSSNIDNIIANPSEYYSDPAQVIEDESKTESEKHQILNAWKSEAIHLQESEAEGFEGGENSRLDSVEKAIETLNKESESSVLKDLNN